MSGVGTTSTKVAKGVFLVVWLTTSGSVGLGSATACESGAKSVNKAESKIRVEAPFEMPDLVVPSFADRDFDIRDYGAVGDGDALNTEAFTKAIAACAEAGGGRVVVPAGRWLTGGIHLKSNVNLHLGEGSEVLFSTDANDYLPVVFVRWAGFECYNYSPLIYARDCTNIAITGPGKLNGQGEAWWHLFRGEQEAAKNIYEMVLRGIGPEKRVFGTMAQPMRPQFIEPINCRNVLLDGFTLTSGPFWSIQLVYCENVIARNLRLLTSGPNNDGLNADSSRNVLIEHCYFATADDCVAIKSGLNEDGWRVGKASENIVIRNCEMRSGHGGVVIGSEMSGGVRNVYAHDCVMRGTDRGLRIKSTRGRGGIVENVWFENMRLDNIQEEGVLLNTSYRAWFGSDSGKAPVFRNIHVKNIRCLGARTAADIFGLPEQPIENVFFENVQCYSHRGLTCEWAKNVAFSNVNISLYKRDDWVMRFKECTEMSVTGSTSSPLCETFLILKGNKTNNVRLSNNDLSSAKQPVVFEEGAMAEAVTIR